MNENNNRSVVIGAVICTLFAAQIYAFKWAVFFFVPTSIWRVADLCGNLESFLGKGIYGFMAVCIRIGALISVVMLLRDAYIIAKPLMDRQNGKQTSKRAGVGGIISVIYTLSFIIMIYAANDSEMKAASITLWPVVGVALCIVARVLLKHKDKATDDADESTRINSMDYSRHFGQSRDTM